MRACVSLRFAFSLVKEACHLNQGSRGYELPRYIALPEPSPARKWTRSQIGLVGCAPAPRAAAPGVEALSACALEPILTSSFPDELDVHGIRVPECKSAPRLANFGQWVTGDT